MATISTKNKFREYLSLNGVHHNNYYDVDMSYPSALVDKKYNHVEELLNSTKSSLQVGYTGTPIWTVATKEFSKLVRHYCIAVDVPSSVIQSTQVRTYGEPFEVPSTKTYSELNFRFYSDASGNLYKLFANWIDSIYDPITRTMGYLGDYTTNCTVKISDTNLNSVAELYFEKMWPKSIGSIPLSGESGTTVTSFNVSMNYRRMYNIMGYKSPESYGK